jgi:hypothetical protein
LFVAAIAVVMELALLALTMMIVTIVVVASSVQPVAPALVSNTLQFVFLAHALGQLMSLWQ